MTCMINGYVCMYVSSLLWNSSFIKSKIKENQNLKLKYKKRRKKLLFFHHKTIAELGILVWECQIR
jgi:hypothetical protein